MKYNALIHHRRSIRLKGYDYSQAGAYFITICCHNRHCIFGEIVGVGFTPAPDKEGQPQGIATTIATTLATTIATKTVPTMVLNDYGKIASHEWEKLPERFSNIELDVFQIMPNHMHGIIVMNEDNGVTDDKNGATNDNNGATNDNNRATNDNNGATDDNNGATARVPPTNTTIGDILGAYKSLVANECLKLHIQRAGVNPAPTMGKLWQRNYYEHIIRNEQSYQTISDYIINNPAKWYNDKFFVT